MILEPKQSVRTLSLDQFLLLDISPCWGQVEGDRVILMVGRISICPRSDNIRVIVPVMSPPPPEHTILSGTIAGYLNYTPGNVSPALRTHNIVRDNSGISKPTLMPYLPYKIKCNRVSLEIPLLSLAAPRVFARCPVIQSLLSSL